MIAAVICFFMALLVDATHTECDLKVSVSTPEASMVSLVHLHNMSFDMALCVLLNEISSFVSLPLRSRVRLRYSISTV